MPGWTLYPVTNGANLRLYDLHRELRDAIVERGRAALGFFPQPNHPYGSGFVSSITNTGFSDTNAVWYGGLDDVSGNTYRNPWAGTIASDSNTWIPSSWQVVFEPPTNPDLSVVAQIASWVNTGSATFTASIANAVTSKQLGTNGLNTLVGAYYYFNAAGSLASRDRLMTWPSDYPWANGVVQTLASASLGGITIPASPAAGLIRVDNAPWATSTNLAGRDLVFTDASSGLLKRVTVLSSTNIGTANLIRYAGTNVATTGKNFRVVGVGGRCDPERSELVLGEFYRGERDSFCTLGVDDSQSFALLPKQSVGLLTAVSGECETLPKPIYDDDPWTNFAPDADSDCGRPLDTSLNPGIFRTQHGLDVGVDLLCSNFVEAIDYTGATAIPFLNPAERNRIAGINSASCMTGDVAGASGNDGSSNNQIALSGLSLPAGTNAAWFTPMMVQYSIRLADGNYHGGRGLLVNTTTLQCDTTAGDTFTQANGTNAADSGRAIYLSPGFTRVAPKKFKRMEDQTEFIADLVSDGMGGLMVQDPPAVADFADSGASGVGTYATKPASKQYIEAVFETADWTSPQGFSNEGPDSKSNFMAGDIARWEGEHYFSPVVDKGVNLFVPASGTDGTEIYWSHFYCAGHPTNTANFLRAQLSGTATAASAIGSGSFFLYTPDKNFFDFNWFGNGTNGLRLESGTATAGSTTSLSDSSKTNANAAGCPWRSYRFGTNGSSWVGFTVAVDFGTGTNAGLFSPTFTDWRYITSGTLTASLGQVSWNEAMRSSANGKPYEIYEAYQPFRFKGRNITVTPTNGASWSGTVRGCFSQGLFVTGAATNTIGAGAGYSIQELQPSGTYRRDTANASWIPLTSGTDTARLTVHTPTNFVSYSPGNRPHYHYRFGRAMPGDAFTIEFFNERQAAVNALVWIWRLNMGWTDHASATASEDANQKTLFRNVLYASNSAQFGTAWAALSPTGADSLPPVAIATIISSSLGCYNISATRRYAYPTATRNSFRYSAALDFWAFAIPPGLPAPATNSFDGNGDVVMGWNNVGSTSFSGTIATAYGGAVGDTGLSEPDLPALADAGGTKSQGYQITNQLFIEKYNQAGGFKYY